MPPKKNKQNASNEEPTSGEAQPDLANDVASEAPNDEEATPSGGLMAMMRKRQKKKKAGSNFLEGEDLPETKTSDLPDKAPLEASVADEFEPLAEKSKRQPKSINRENEDVPGEEGDGGKILTKAQKEKLKKEREKQRKKDNVCQTKVLSSKTASDFRINRLLRRKLRAQLSSHLPNPKNKLLKWPNHQPQLSQ
ncbi:Bgt-4917 [Blumeria graminis f. sp. tritici]|uniref:Bgt-4917 n=1 Tax=Blumeria graminis f. sp. tritici TaxID=62690 RepID=A0A9X9MEN0_BLUGR|nr:Bgt-4917 [Blumeria graminis f. sp. tritici]